MENFIEKSPEKIPTKQEVLDVISRFVENPTIVIELADERGLYSLEVKVEGKKPGETIQYEYLRKGSFPNGYKSTSTVIHVVYREDGKVVWGENVADYNYETGEWK